jgi:hypothetical protein
MRVTRSINGNAVSDGERSRYKIGNLTVLGIVARAIRRHG